MFLQGLNRFFDNIHAAYPMLINKRAFLVFNFASRVNCISFWLQKRFTEAWLGNSLSWLHYIVSSSYSKVKHGTERGMECGKEQNHSLRDTEWQILQNMKIILEIKKVIAKRNNLSWHTLNANTFGRTYFRQNTFGQKNMTDVFRGISDVWWTCWDL